MTGRTVLLNPGPVTLTPRVRRALSLEDVCHREPEFAALTLEIKSALERVYGGDAADFEAVLLTGSGTCAVESMLASLLVDGGKTLVVANGVYGERMAAMLRAHGRPVETIQGDWLHAIDLSRVEQCLQADPTLTHVAAVHHETTTGRLNAIESLASLCGQYRRHLLLDAVSSFGAEPIPFSHPSLLAVASTANKCLHGVVGACFVLARRSLLQGGRSSARSVYLDLFTYYAEQKRGFSPFTQAVQSYFALREALREFEEQGGWVARHDRYRHLSHAIREALSGLGIRSLLAAHESSVALSSFALPGGWAYQTIHDELRQAGFVIYAGQSALYHSLFRVANMGDIRDDDIDRLIAAFRRVFDRKAP